MTPKAPKGLSAESKRIWRGVHSEYDIGPASSDILAESLRALDKAREAEAIMTREGMVQADRFGQKKPHAAHAIYRDNLNLFLKGVAMLRLDLEPLAAVGRPAGR